MIHIVAAACGTWWGMGGGCGSVSVQPQPAQQPAPAAPVGEFASSDALLTALEKADEGMVTLTADITYDVELAIQGDRQIRKGKLYFDNRPPRKFAILFKELWLGDVVRSEEQLIVFDGEWLVEKNFKEKMMVKRQVVPPGQKFDPLKIGEGPLPIPLGQKKADVTLRFSTELQPVNEGLAAPADADTQERAQAETLKKHVEGATQIRLTPKPEFVRETDFTDVRLWYRRNQVGILLPVMARTVSRNGNITVVMLSDVQLQQQGAAKNPKAEMPADLVRIDAPPPGWDFDQQPFRKHLDGQPR